MPYTYANTFYHNASEIIIITWYNIKIAQGQP